MIQTKFIPQGWECPKCNRVYSPTTSMCSHCPVQAVTTAGTTGTTFSSGTTWYTHNFESDKKSTSNGCKICGLQQWQHPNITYTNNL
jgi:hypothetical protein